MKNKKKFIFLLFIFSLLFSIGIFISSDDIGINISTKYLGPSFEHFFGTDWLGRDMFLRVMKGLNLSIAIGMGVSILSGLIALIVGVISGFGGKWADRILTGIIDLFITIPSTIAVILISVALGGGIKGVVVGISITHWPSLARVIRGEVLQVRNSDYVKISRKLGKSKLYIIIHHILPHITQQLIIGIIILFPHAILHEASISFLGFGLQPHEASIGIILSEGMKYLSSGKWWLTFLPGLTLVCTSLILDTLGKTTLNLFNRDDYFYQEVK